MTKDTLLSLTNDTCRTLLKRKGTGAHMGKSLTADECRFLPELLRASDVNLTTRATLLTALLTLTPTSDEESLIEAIHGVHFAALPSELQELCRLPEDAPRFLTLIHELILLQDLSETDAKWGFERLFSGTEPEHRCAAFMEALRLKRETPIENRVCYEVLLAHSQSKSLDVSLLVDIADPYDGFNRHLNLSVFLGPVLAAIGIPSVLQGIDEIGPKNGVSAHKILDLAGKSTERTLEEAETDLLSAQTGWTYVAQPAFSKALFDLKTCRINMVKRPLLATLEKLLLPLRGQRSMSVTGFTHPPYKAVLQALMSHGPMDDALICRGVEGSSLLPLDRRAPVLTDVEDAGFVRPEDYGLSPIEITPDYDLTTQNSLDAGLSALKGEAGLAFSQLHYMASFIAHRSGQYTQDEAPKVVHDALISGKALSHWESFQ